jgi:hypothetical protein
MASLFPIFSLLLVIVVSLLVVRVATVALVFTGLSQQLARFQARSAFTGAGFTTTESEKVTQHPLRRRIIMLLMLLGNAGLVTAISSLMLSFLNSANREEGVVWYRLLALALGLVVLWGIAYSNWVDERMTRLIEWGLKRWTDLDVRDYSGLLHLARGYSVIELEVQRGDWLTEKNLANLKLNEEGVLVLGIEQGDGEYVGAPRGETKFVAGDTVILYGPSHALDNLDQRRTGSAGNWDHHRAVDKQRQTAEEEKRMRADVEGS